MDNSDILYIVKVSIAISMFYGIYMLFLREDTFNHIKRAYLLLAIVASLLLPLCNVDFMPLTGNLAALEALLPQIEIVQADAASIADATSNKTTSLLSIIYYILIGGIFFLFSKLVIQLGSIIKIRISNDMRNDNGTNVICMNRNTAPFSFFDWIFIPQNISKQQEKSTIIAHERIHVRQNHSFDLLFCELFCIFFWWNPIAWLVKREVCINLEYLADEGVLREGFDPKNYQYLLLKITNPNASISIINKFNVSQLKNRIMMINKEKTRKILCTKYLLAIPVVLLVLLTNVSLKAQLSTTVGKPPVHADGINQTRLSGSDTEPYVKVEEMPIYPGGIDELLKFVSENLEYPAEAVKNGIEGLVVVRFVVTKTGDISNVSIIRGISPECDNEAIRVVNSMPKWQPGKQDGKEVSVYYSLPVKYSLGKKAQEDKQE